jgi:hypothetical protein
MQVDTLSSTIWQPYEENLTMTFQVVLVGCDGLIVGSDRRVLVRSPATDSDGRKPAWQSLPDTKFIKSEDESLICAFAGGPQSRSIATAFVAEWDKCHSLRQAEWENKLRTTAEVVKGNSRGDEIIVVRKDQPNRVLLVTRDNQDVGIQPIESTICTGTSLNARFVSASFWKSTAVNSLRRLALLTLGYAAIERPGEVGDGFDLMILEASSGTIRWENFQPNDLHIACLVEEFSETARHFILQDDRDKT